MGWLAMALGGCSATPKGQKNFNFLIFFKNLALGGGSATPKGQTHFKNKFFLPLGVVHAVASATLDRPV
jgi:hypothetical protein